MSFPQFGYTYPSAAAAAAASSLASSQLLMSSSSSSPSSGSKCCEGGRPIMTDPHTGQTVCSCQYSSSLLSYPRVAGLPESMYSSAYAAQGYMPFGTDPSAFYSPLNAAAYELKEGQEALRSLAQPAYYSYDPTMAGYPYGYGGMDLNAAARRKNATRENTNTLKAWLYEHRKNPYPTKGEKIMLAIITKMTLTQVSTWFANARRRLKKENKMTWSPRNRTDDDEDGDRSDIDHDDDDQAKSRAGDNDADHKDDDSDDEFIDAGSESDLGRLSFPDPTRHHPVPEDKMNTDDHSSRPSSPALTTAATTTTTTRPWPSHSPAHLSPRGSDHSSSLPPSGSQHGDAVERPLSVGSPESLRSSTASPLLPATPVESKPAVTTTTKPRIWSLADVATSSSNSGRRSPPPATTLVGLSHPHHPHPHTAPPPTHPTPPRPGQPGAGFPAHLNGLRTWMNGAYPLHHPYVLAPHALSGAGGQVTVTLPSPATHALSTPPRSEAMAVHLPAFGGVVLSSAAFKPHDMSRPSNGLPHRTSDSPKSSPEGKSDISPSREGEQTAFRPVTKRLPQL